MNLDVDEVFDRDDFVVASQQPHIPLLSCAATRQFESFIDNDRFVEVDDETACQIGIVPLYLQLDGWGFSE